MIVFDRAVFTDFAAVQASMTTIGDDVVINYTAEDTLTIYGTAPSLLVQDDFWFV